MTELRDALERFREWHANHFGDFTPEVNAELVCLDNAAADALAVTSLSATGDENG